jgi:DNA-binding MarR family transcriptional regulator
MAKSNSNKQPELNVSAAQLFVLRELGKVPDQWVEDLAAVTMTTHSTVSQVVSQLLSKGLVARTRDEGDGRRSVLRLTPQGARLERKSPRVIQTDLIKGFATACAGAQRFTAKGQVQTSEYFPQDGGRMGSDGRSRATRGR